MPGRATALRFAGIVGYAAPPPGYPFPVPYPMYPSWPAKTAQGVGYVRWALVLAILLQAINIAWFAWVAAVLALAASGAPGLGGTLDLFVTSLAFVCAAGIVGFVAVIFILLGVYTSHDGREEYGPDHAREMDNAVIFLIIAFVMGVIASASLGAGGFGATPLAFQFPLSPIGGLFGTVRGLFVGLLLVSLVKVFISREERDEAWIGVAILTISPAVGTVVALLIALVTPPVDPFTIPTIAPLAFAAAAVLASAELIAYVVFLRIYSNVHRRMRAGELPPIPRPSPMYTPYYPAYYPPWPVVPEAPPSAPPPPGPPP